MLSRSWTSSFLAVFTATLLTSFSAYAGAGSGGGGDFRCAEYADLANRIVSTLAAAGQEQINSLNNAIRIDALIRVRKRLVCIPVISLDRQARSYPETGRTDLLVSSWEQLSRKNKVRLTAHELLVLAGYERDGEYGTSDQILRILQKSSIPLVGQDRVETASPTSYVVAKANEIKLYNQLEDVDWYKPTLAVKGRIVATFGVMRRSHYSSENQVALLLNRILSNVREDQLIRIDMDKLPANLDLAHPEKVTNCFHIENDL